MSASLNDAVNSAQVGQRVLIEWRVEDLPSEHIHTVKIIRDYVPDVWLHDEYDNPVSAWVTPAGPVLGGYTITKWEVLP